MSINNKNNSGIVLMLQNIPVLSFNIDEYEYSIYREDLLPFSLKNAFRFSKETSSNDELAKIKAHNRDIIIDFLSKRVLNINRENAKKLLNAYNFSQSQDSITKAKIAITCKAISMIDDYWLNDSNLSLRWEDINIRENSLNEIVAHIALHGKSFSISGVPHTPELTGQGAYAKAWMRKEDGAYLYKKSSKGGIESEIEVMTSKILDCFDVEHVNYFEDKSEGAFVCVCKNMSSAQYCIVPAEEVFTYCNREDINFMNYALKIDSESIYKMCIVDYLISNRDRHMLNWGFYMNNSTGHLLKCHPIFDHNNAFDIEFMRDKEGGQSLIFQGKTQKEVAYMAMKKAPLRCIKPVTRDMFINKEMYESFMHKAVKLGLYKQLKPSFLQKLGIKSFEKYVPCCIYSRKNANTTKNIDYLIEQDNHQYLNVKKRKNILINTNAENSIQEQKNLNHNNLDFQSSINNIKENLDEIEDDLEL